jgi:HlyD family secretion protein
MDIPRSAAAKQRRRRQIGYTAAGIALVVLATMGLSKLKPAATAVERSALGIDTVKRGPMLRQVRGLGTLVPEEIRWIPAATEGRVDRILVLPGTAVKADTVLLELKNPQLEQEALDSEWKLKAAEADYKNWQVQLASQVLAQKSEAAKSQSEYTQAKLQADTDAELEKLGVISENAVKISKEKARELATRNEIERQRLDNSGQVREAQLQAKQAEIQQFRALARLKQSRLDGLRVRAGSNGVLQDPFV